VNIETFRGSILCFGN